jgi:DNA-binding transcriptional LysR family regulator
MAAFEHPRHLAQHRLIMTPPILSWSFLENGTGAEFGFNPREPACVSSDLPLAAEAVRRGLGVGYLPHPLVAGDLGGELVEVVIPGWRPPDRDMHAVYPAGSFRQRCGPR